MPRSAFPASFSTSLYGPGARSFGMISSDFDVSLVLSSAGETNLILEMSVRSYNHKEAGHGARAKISKNWL